MKTRQISLRLAMYRSDTIKTLRHQQTSSTMANKGATNEKQRSNKNLFDLLIEQSCPIESESGRSCNSRYTDLESVATLV